MAIGKWMPFAPQQSTQAAEDAKPQSIQLGCADAKQFGLENFGNTCYANSVLQALYFCAPFREFVIQHPDPFGSPAPPPQLRTMKTSTPLPTQVASPARRKPERRSTTDSSSLPTTSQPAAPTSPPSNPRTLFSALRSLYIHISQNTADKGTIAPRALIDKLKEVNEIYRSPMHQDAHEFLNFLLNKVVEEIEDDKKHAGTTPTSHDLSSSIQTLSSDPPPTGSTIGSHSNNGASSHDVTFIHKLFEGILTSETRCLTCENVSSRDESFLDLSIDIDQNSSVTACLRQFSASEMLCQKNKFFCDACCDLQEAEKRMKIKRLPNVLALHLKRFKYQEDVQKYIKLTYRVAFPLELRLFNTVDDAPNPDRLYELFAIVVHIGNGPHHGHYISIIKTLGNWLVFDDDTVDSIKESEIPKYFGDSNSGSAYVLYYQAVDLDLGALGLRFAPTETTHLESDERQPSDIVSSSPQVTPALPPGLADAPDTEETLTPSTPLLPPWKPPIVITPEKSPRKAASQILKLNISSSSGSSAPSSLSLGPSTNSNSSAPSSPLKNGIFNSLRHPPSTRLSTEKREYAVRALPTPPIPPVEDIAKTPSVTSFPPVNNSEKELDRSKDTEKKTNTWFGRRKSSRVGGEKPRPVSQITSEPGSLRSGDDMSSPTTLSSNPWFRTNATNLKQSKDRNGIIGPNGSIYHVSSPHRKIPEPSVQYQDIAGELKHFHDKESPSPDSATSLASSSTGQAPLSPTALTDPLSPALVASSMPTIPYQTNPSAYNYGPANDERPPFRPIPIPRYHEAPPIRTSRPATAGARISPIKELPPTVPPIPSPTHVLPNGRSHATNGRLRTDGYSSATEKLQRPKSANATVGLDVAPSFSTNHHNSPAPTGDAGATRKRATRKLSLTAPMLAFGRRDKQKDK